MKYHVLQPEKIAKTVDQLQKRICDRFPDSSLQALCGQLLDVANNAEKESAWLGQPIKWMRVFCWVFSGLILMLSVGTLFFFAEEKISKLGFTELVQVMEAGINDVVLIGAAVFFVLTFETRYKRNRALKSIHELRSIAHIIDMHQLTKDPERPKDYIMTQHSRRQKMTQFELRRYLDYCTEMLSLTGKVAAVYVQNFGDGVALSAVNEVETLTTGLSRKIWQKLNVLYLHEEGDVESKRIIKG